MIAALALVLAACLAPPVPGPITEPFVAPTCTYCAGHRGVGFAAEPGTAVVAAADGVVTFAGGVAGVRYVVVRHADGRRATYGLLRTVLVHQGQAVRQGQTLALSGGLVHFGLRAAAPADDVYLDPTPELGRWVGRPRLVPVDGSPPRVSPPARFVCRSPG